MKFYNKYQSLLLIILSTLITSCSETTFLINSAKKIGSWDEDPMYKIGDPYKINGKWYYPAVDYTYNEVGIASWYGPGFHGKKTANGEIFDQNKITAAHKTLPLPSIVRVTNLENGKVLPSVRVNDRGPFVKNRIIDLSKKAANELGFMNKGVARVRVEILEDESRKFANELIDTNRNKSVSSAEVKEIKKKDISQNIPIEINSDESIKANKNEKANSILKENIAIQVGAFTDHRNAKDLIKKLHEFKAYIKREFVNERYLYRVRIGPLKDIDIANQVKEKLFDLGLTSSHLIMN